MMYAAPRAVVLENAVGPWVHVDRGIVAGCALARHVLEAFLVQARQQALAGCFLTRFRLYVDDARMNSRGTIEEI
eukprot:6184497-Alexandrium_andersonii.AAC.1